MAGRLISSKKLLPLLGADTGSIWFGHCHSSIEAEVKADRALERFSDDPPEAGTSLDEPFLFSKYPNNRYFFARYYYERQEYEVRSIYKCLEVRNQFNCSRLPTNCIILLISDGKMAVGHYKEGSLTSQRELTNQRDFASEKTPRAFLNEISSFMRSWKKRFSEAELVFIRCTQFQYDYLFEGLKELEKEKYRHIPFVTCPPSVEETQRVYSRLFTYVFYGDIEQTLADLQQERRSWSQATQALPQSVKKSSKSQRKSEKQQFPWLDAKTATQVHEAVLRNDGNRLQELLSSTSRLSEMRDYLNQPQEKLNNGCFLHYAVRMEKPSSVEVLLEFGADPTVEDGQKKVAFDYCKGGKIEEIFWTFRDENEESFDWNKAKIVAQPVPVLKENHREEFDKRAARDKLRSQRREKLDKRRVKIDAY